MTSPPPAVKQMFHGHLRWRVLPVFLALLGSSALARGEEQTGRQILDEVARRHEAPCQYEEQTMTLIDKKGNREVRQLRTYARKGEQGLFKYLLVFDDPPGVRGVGLLTWQNAGADDDQWLYLPAYGEQTKRVAKGSKRSYFMGTDFTYEDMVSESRDQFAYERKPDETLDGVGHYVVEITPADPDLIQETGYKRRTVWVRKDAFFITRTDYFDRQGKLLKRQTAGDLAQVQGELWRGNTARMENFSNGHSTVVQTRHRLLEEAAVPEEIFRQRFLTSGRHLR